MAEAIPFRLKVKLYFAWVGVLFLTPSLLQLIRSLGERHVIADFSSWWWWALVMAILTVAIFWYEHWLARSFLAAVLVTLLFLSLLRFNHYIVVDANGIVFNDYWTLRPVRYGYDDISKVGITTGETSEGPYTCYGYMFSDGRIWEYSSGMLNAPDWWNINDPLMAEIVKRSGKDVYHAGNRAWCWVD